MFKKFTNGCVRVVNRWLPDAFLFAAILTIVVFIGATMDLALAWDIADTLNGLMAIPNLIGVLVLSPKVVKETKRHFRGEEFVPLSDWKE